MRRAVMIGALVGSVGMAGGVAWAGSTPWVRFIATEVETSPTALATVPPSTIDALLQSRIFGSRNGQYWASQVITLQNATTSRAVVSGTRTGIDFALGRLQTMPGLDAAFEASAVGLDVEALVNDAGDIAISGNLVPTTLDECIVLYRRSNQTYSFVAREGSAIPGIAGESFGGGIDQRTLLNDGRVLFRDSATTGNLPSSQDEFIFLSAGPTQPFTTIAQGGVLVPTGQSIQPNVVLLDVELGYGVNDDATQYIVRGILNRASPNVVVVRNGAIELEVGQPLPGVGTPTPPFSTAVSITDAGMGPSGDWYIAGRGLSGGAPWLVFNGRVIFTSDGDFPGGVPGERVSAITNVNITTRGDLHYTVRAGSPSRDFSVVIPPGPNAQPIVALKTGDPIDFNNNGDPFDDTWSVLTMFSTFLCDDGTMYVIARHSTVGDVIGWVPVTLPPLGPTPCTASDVAGPNQSVGADGVLTADDIIVFLGWYFASDTRADVAGANQSTTPDGQFTADDIIVFLGRYFAGC
ncbi:MAG: hypothetical protein MUE97_04015 [Phycisphaerales bacterium]|jgi:hypothetical protein|nr:hypothetical protein [Phycisphaerales bacterium]